MEAPVPDLNDELRSDVVGNNDGIGVVGPLESLTEQDILRRVFRTEDDAYEFYKSFGKVCGFGVRRGDMFKDEDDNLIRRTFFCNRQGLRDKKHFERTDRERPHKPERRTNCEARLCVYLDKSSNVWQVKKVILNHNHEMTPVSMVHLITTFRMMTECRGARYRHLRRGNTWQALQADIQWAEATEQYGMHEARWWQEVYGKRKMWANAYLCDKFCAGYRTTSRCEGINAVVKKFLQSKHTMLELVQNLELLTREYRNNELLAQFRSLYGSPVMTTALQSIERSAASVYTRFMFLDVRKEIEALSKVVFVGVRRSLNTKVYTVEEFGLPGHHLTVLSDKNMGKMQCQCRFWDRFSYPCKHLFFVMKHEHMSEIAESLILKGWTKNAKTLETYAERHDDGGDWGFLLRHGALHSACQWLFFLGAQKFELFTVASEGIRDLCMKLESLYNAGPGFVPGEMRRDVRDPAVVRTKGAPRKKKIKRRKCAKCNKEGHTKRSCPDKVSKKKRGRRAKKARVDVSPTEEGDVEVTGSNCGRNVTDCGDQVNGAGQEGVHEANTAGDDSPYGNCLNSKATRFSKRLADRANNNGGKPMDMQEDTGMSESTLGSPCASLDESRNRNKE